MTLQRQPGLLAPAGPMALTVGRVGVAPVVQTREEGGKTVLLVSLEIKQPVSVSFRGRETECPR